jgi:hypothetical protein
MSRQHTLPVALANDSVDQRRPGFADGIEFEETFQEVAALPAAREPAAPRLTLVRSAPAVRGSEALPQDQLAEGVRTRREEEERLAAFADEIVGRIEKVLVEWQGRFEQRLDAWRVELERALDQRATYRQAFAAASSARDVGRILRALVSGLTNTTAFALAVHDDRRDAVLYRYRVATDDEVGELLRRDSLDDGPDSAATHMTSWFREHRTVRAGTRNATVHAARLAVRIGDATVGVLTLQSETPIHDDVLACVADLTAAAAPHLARLRDSGSLRGA